MEDDQLLLIVCMQVHWWLMTNKTALSPIRRPLIKWKSHLEAPCLRSLSTNSQPRLLWITSEPVSTSSSSASFLQFNLGISHRYTQDDRSSDTGSSSPQIILVLQCFLFSFFFWTTTTFDCSIFNFYPALVEGLWVQDCRDFFWAGLFLQLLIMIPYHYHFIFFYFFF